MKNMKKLLSLLVVEILCISACALVVGNATEIETISNKISNNNDPISLNNNESDQSQIDMNFAIPIGGFPMPERSNETINITVAQSFIPTKPILTRVEILTGKNLTASTPFVLAIRDGLTEENIVQISVEPEEFITENFSWIEFDFDDIPVTVGQTYYMICYTDNISDNWYAWAAHNDSESYPRGCAWVSIDDGDTWINESEIISNPAGGMKPLLEDDVTSDMCFKTYGLEQTETDLKIELIKKDEIIIGLPTITIKNNGSISASNIEWSADITVIEGLILTDKHFEDTIFEIPPGEEQNINLGLVLGIGIIEITAIASAENALETTDTMQGFVLFILFI